MIADAGFHYTSGAISLLKLANARFFITPSNPLYGPTSTITSINLKTYKQGAKPQAAGLRRQVGGEVITVNYGERGALPTPLNEGQLRSNYSSLISFV